MDLQIVGRPAKNRRVHPVMLTDVSQRWRDRRTTYMPNGDTINPAEYEVASIAGDTEAKAFVTQHHYSGSYPAARARVGLYRRGALAGVAVFSIPMQAKVLSVLPCAAEAAVELGRFVLLDDVARNGETWFLRQAFAILRKKGFAGVVSFSDPLPRRGDDGRVVHAGHVGTVYQAFNAIHRGRSTPRTQYLLPNGTEFSARSAQKIRAGECGWSYAVDQLVAAGAPRPLCGRSSWTADLGVWLREVLPRVTTRRRHRGNLRYLFGLHPAVRHQLGKSDPYPKLIHFDGQLSLVETAPADRLLLAA